MSHHIYCNYQNGPIGGEGCICVVIPKIELQELRKSQIDQQEVDQSRQKAFQDVLEAYEGGEGEIRSRFDPGTFGAHEATDRMMITIENIESYILNHPTVIMDKKAYKKVYEAHQLLYDVYNLIACAEPVSKDK